MLEPKDILIEDMSFTLHPLKGMKAVILDKKVITFCMPILGALENLNSKTVEDIDFRLITKNIEQSLAEMGDEEFEKFVLDLLATVQFHPAGEAPVEINKVVIDKYFAGKSTALYLLLIHAMEYNKFSPFKWLAENGVEMNDILSFGGQKNQDKELKK